MKHSNERRRFNLAALLALGPLGCPILPHAQVVAEDYPSRPVHWIVPTSPGAGTDFAARAFARLLGQTWQQAVVVDNRSGAAGMIGLNALATAAPDGYTLAFISVSQFVDAILQQKYVFDATKDFTPISRMATAPLILVANADSKLTSLQQLVSFAKSRPKELNYSSGGSGGVTHLAMELFLKKAGIQMLHVPYKGSGPAVLGLLGGQVQVSFATPAAVMVHIKSGRLNALAVATDSRSPLAPDIPTFADLGFPGVSMGTWYGLFGPAKMTPTLVDKISRDVIASVRKPAVRNKMLADGVEVIADTPAEFAKFLDGEREQWTTVARNINFRPEK